MLRLDFSVSDLLNTSVHFPNEPSATGLEFFTDGHYTAAFERLGFYSSADFVELGSAFGVPEDEVGALISGYAARQDAVEKRVAASRLSEEAKSRYLAKFRDRLRAIAQ